MVMLLLLLIVDILSPQKPEIPNGYKSNWAVLWRNSLDNFENKTTVLWISLLEHKLNRKINWKLNRTDYNLKCIVDSFLLDIQ